jgi:hypothetical protein
MVVIAASFGAHSTISSSTVILLVIVLLAAGYFGGRGYVNRRANRRNWR